MSKWSRWEKLLGIQGELERCQEIEEELHNLQKETEVESIQNEIKRMKMELNVIQQMFESNRRSYSIVSTNGNNFL